MVSSVFVNLAVKDLNTSKAFFEKLGFSFNPQFTNDTGACLVIDDGHIYAMLLTEAFFSTFTKRTIADTASAVEVLNALAVESREKVDWYANTAIQAGGKLHRDPEDHGWMYAKAIEDLDGHVWEFVWMDAAQIPK